MAPDDFKWKHFAPAIILWYLRWYGSTPLSYAHVSDMLAERGISVHRSTIYRWFIQYAPVLRKKLKNINSFGLFPPGSSMKLMSELTENGFIFTVQLINTAIRWISIFPRNVTAMLPMNFSNGY